MTATQLLVWGFAIHCLADLFLQNEWMALHKTSLRHPASWTHAAIHGVLLLLIFPPLPALVLAVSHLLIDLRAPLTWWGRLYRQSTIKPDSHPALHAFGFWRDQSAHIIALTVVALCVDHAWLIHLWWR